MRKLAGIECERLPQHTAINDILAEAHAVAQLQLTETLTQEGQHNAESYILMAQASLATSMQATRLQQNRTLTLWGYGRQHLGQHKRPLIHYKKS